jgi:hypothetical protein
MQSMHSSGYVTDVVFSRPAGLPKLAGLALLGKNRQHFLFDWINVSQRGHHTVMFKALRNSIIFVGLLLIAIASFTSAVKPLEVDQTPQLHQRLISSVQAEATPQKRVAVAAPISQSPKLNESRQSQPSSHKSKPNQRLVLQFKSTHNRLNGAERAKLESMLQSLEVGPFHSAEIFSGTAPYENSLPYPQTAKLRAQNVARIIYPYTQTVKMHYSPSLEESKVIVEFFEP